MNDVSGRKKVAGASYKKRILLLLLACAVLAIWIVLAAIFSSGVAEPSYGGRSLSAWLDDLRGFNHYGYIDPYNPSVKAVRSIGTNAVPWLLKEIRLERKPWHYKAKLLLTRQRLMRVRFPDIDARLLRAERGFWILGKVAEPAIPALAKLAEQRPNGPAQMALAGIGDAALPILANCLTKYGSSNEREAQLGLGNTLGSLQNGMGSGRIKRTSVGALLPTIRQVAQSTNHYAAQFATAIMSELGAR